MYLIFDTETTGLPNNWSAPITDTDNWPNCVQLAWQIYNNKGELLDVQSYIIDIKEKEIPLDVSSIHKITTENSRNHGISIEEVLGKFSDAIASVDYVVGHNVLFDINIISCEYYRCKMNKSIDSLNSKKIIDTMKSTIDYCGILTHDNNSVVVSSDYVKTLPEFRGSITHQFKIVFKNGDYGFCYSTKKDNPVKSGEKIYYNFKNRAKATLSVSKKPKFKFPKLEELYKIIFKENFIEAHNASFDVEATSRCFLELLRRNEVDLGVSGENVKLFAKNNKNQISLLGKAQVHVWLKEAVEEEVILSEKEEIENTSFFHLSCHSSYSILKSTAHVKDLVKKAADSKMPAISITDYGNLYGAFQFVEEAISNNITPIVGCAFYLTEDHSVKKFTREKPDVRYIQVLYAKNKIGFQNLSKLCSEGHVNGTYSDFPRIDKKLILKYKEGLIASASGIRGIISQLILKSNSKVYNEEFLWWKNNFQEDFYVQLNRHGVEFEKEINNTLLGLSKDYKVKYYCSNDIFYINKDDHETHDALLCIGNGALKETPIGKGRGFRYGLPDNKFYFKSSKEMSDLFSDLPESFETLNEILNKIELYELAREVVMPEYVLPDNFKNQDEYLKYLSYEGAKQKYNDFDKVKNRIDFELNTIKNSGYPGYFLIVYDIIFNAKKMGVSVGPGRGSAAGSVVAYCLGITNVDPIKYNLLFERFLNPDRISLPDIDIDFDDEGRARLIEWVISKYGKDKVAQIITYGKMAARSSIRDIGRVLGLDLSTTDMIAKLIPANHKLSDLLKMNVQKIKDTFRSEEFDSVIKLVQAAKQNDMTATVINEAAKIEGCLRSVGIHACGFIITPTPITDYIPVTIAKDSDLYVTQYDNYVVENAGMLKMDFLGLRNLSTIKDTVKIIKALHDIDIDIDNIDLEDKKTFELFKSGHTKAIFQMEKPFVQRTLRKMMPDKFEDIIALNALNRPGPMAYIPDYIKRKHGIDKVTYPLPEMENLLSDTYGITVYQEQVMLLSQKLANFSGGDADRLRKGMGKKDKKVIDELKPKFIAGCKQNKYDDQVVLRIWEDWEKFASYAFNKSHSTCYAFIGFQTAYLKSHYPSEYMASVLTHWKHNIDKISEYMEECRRMGVLVNSCDVNESYSKFAVNEKKEIRFGLEAVKGIGTSAVNNIINERKKNGKFKSVIDFVERVNLQSVNKRVIESLVNSGGFDSFGFHRSSYFEQENNKTFIERLIEYGHKFQENSIQKIPQLPFGEKELELTIQKPSIGDIDHWSKMETLLKEKEVCGIFVTANPLDDYSLEIKRYCNIHLGNMDNLSTYKDKEVVFAGIITECSEKTSRNGNLYGDFILEDLYMSKVFRVFGSNYLQNFKPYLEKNMIVLIKGKVRENQYNKDRDLEIFLNEISLMSEIKNNNKFKLSIKINLDELTDSKIDIIENIFVNNKGDHDLEILLAGPENHNIKAVSKLKINIEENILKKLDELSFDYFLN